MKNILVTGGCGYIGARLCQYLAENDYRVTVLDRSCPEGYEQWGASMEEVITADACDLVELTFLNERSYDAAIHLISLDHHESEGDPDRVCSINVIPIWNLLKQLTKSGLKKFIYFSTVHVYGKALDNTISESFPMSPANAYGLTHLLSENICTYYHQRTETHCINVRLSNSYGSPVFRTNACWQLVVNELCKNAFFNQSIQLASDGSPLRDFIHISDVCRAIHLLLKSDADDQQGNTYNIASGRTRTILDIALTVKKIFDNRYSQNIPVYLADGSRSDRKASCKYPKKYRISTSKIAALGHQCSVELLDGINELFDFLEDWYEGK